MDSHGYALASLERRAGALEWAPQGRPLGRLIAGTDPNDHSEKMLLVDLDPALAKNGRYPTELKFSQGVTRGEFIQVRRIDTFPEIWHLGHR